VLEAGVEATSTITEFTDASPESPFAFPEIRKEIVAALIVSPFGMAEVSKRNIPLERRWY